MAGLRVASAREADPGFRHRRDVGLCGVLKEIASAEEEGESRLLVEDLEISQVSLDPSVPFIPFSDIPACCSCLRFLCLLGLSLKAVAAAMVLFSPQGCSG